MKLIKTFTTKKNKEVQIVEPSMDFLDEVLRYANKFAKEDTFLTFDPGKEISREDEEKWLEAQISGIEKGRSFLVWAVYDGRIIGSVDIHRGGNVREWHIGTIGLMVDADFRGEGLGRLLLEFIIEKAKEMGIRTAVLGVFSTNDTARSLYEKVGFVKYGVLPDGLYHKNKFADHIYMYKRLI